MCVESKCGKVLTNDVGKVRGEEVCMVLCFQLSCRLEIFQNKTLSKKEESSLDLYLPASCYIKYICHPTQPNIWTESLTLDASTPSGPIHPSIRFWQASVPPLHWNWSLSHLHAGSCEGSIPRRWLLPCLEKSLSLSLGHLLPVFLLPRWSPYSSLLSPFLSPSLSTFASLKLRLFLLEIPLWVSSSIDSYRFKNWICSNDVQIWVSSLDLPHADDWMTSLLHFPSWIFHRHLKFNFYSFVH